MCKLVFKNLALFGEFVALLCEVVYLIFKDFLLIELFKIIVTSAKALFQSCDILLKIFYRKLIGGIINACIKELRSVFVLLGFESVLFKSIRKGNEAFRRNNRN